MTTAKTISIRRWIVVVGAVIIAAFLLWVLWSESHPGEEKALRSAMAEYLASHFPETMTPPEEVFGLFFRKGEAASQSAVILIHGLDEPGDLWNDLIPLLAEMPIQVIEFRYPNDQAISASADLLAEKWKNLEGIEEVVVVAHSMGGLVIRDLVTRPGNPRPQFPSIKGVVMVGTPNHGSEWARFRVWLEAREHFHRLKERQFSLFAALRDGTGEAKIDLRPDSKFLSELNDRDWPENLPLLLIAGDLTEEKGMLGRLFRNWTEDLDAELKKAIEDWMTQNGPLIGDGVVTVESVSLDGQPAPVVFPASHRGLVMRTPIDPDAPPANPLILEFVSGHFNGTAEVR